MPIYSVRRLLTVGNPVDGYEVNDTRDAGEVYIPPFDLDVRDDSPHVQQVLWALTAARLIDEHGAGLQVENLGDGDTMEVSQAVGAWGGEQRAAGDSDETRFIAMIPGDVAITSRAYRTARDRAERDLEPGEALVTVEDFEPFYQLEQQILHGGGPGVDGTVFWRTTIQVGDEPRTQVEKVAAAFSRGLREELTPSNMVAVVQRNRAGEPGVCHSHDFCDANMVMSAAFAEVTGREDRGDWAHDDADRRLWNDAWDLAKRNEFEVPHTVEVTLGYDDGQLGVELDPIGVSDRFEWSLADWQRRPTFGFDPVTSEELRPTKAQVQDILVALDRYLESR